MAYKYTSRFIGDGKVGLLIEHLESERDELLEFEGLDDMEACAIARPYIPMETWKELSEMFRETQAHVNPGHIF